MEDHRGVCKEEKYRETLRELKEWIGGESEKTIIGGDFNARTGWQGRK